MNEPVFAYAFAISGQAEISRVISAPYSSAVRSRNRASTSRSRMMPAWEPPPPPATPPVPPARSISDVIVPSPHTRRATSRIRRPVSAVRSKRVPSGSW